MLYELSDPDNTPVVVGRGGRVLQLSALYKLRLPERVSPRRVDGRSYASCTSMAGGFPVPCPLRGSGLTLEGVPLGKADPCTPPHLPDQGPLQIGAASPFNIALAWPLLGIPPEAPERHCRAVSSEDLGSLLLGFKFRSAACCLCDLGQGTALCLRFLV